MRSLAEERRKFTIYRKLFGLVQVRYYTSDRDTYHMLCSLLHLRNKKYELTSVDEDADYIVTRMESLGLSVEDVLAMAALIHS